MLFIYNNSKKGITQSIKGNFVQSSKFFQDILCIYIHISIKYKSIHNSAKFGFAEYLLNTKHKGI